MKWITDERYWASRNDVWSRYRVTMNDELTAREHALLGAEAEGKGDWETAIVQYYLAAHADDVPVKVAKKLIARARKIESEKCT